MSGFDSPSISATLEEMLAEGVITQEVYEEKKHSMVEVMSIIHPKGSSSSDLRSSANSSSSSPSISRNNNAALKPFLKQFSLLSVQDTEQTLAEFLETAQKFGKLREVLQYILEDELARNRAALLREETLGVHILRAFWFHFDGKEYISAIIAPLVNEVMDATKNRSLEFDPVRAKPKDDLKKNLEDLLLIIKKFLRAFYNSTKLFSKDFKYLMEILYTRLTMNDKGTKSHLGLGYSEVALRHFTSFILLRFVCPPMVTPKKYGACSRDMSPDAQRALILVSKLVQSIANQSEFDGQKEAFMLPANNFVQDNVPQMLAFMLTVGEPSYDDDY